MPRGNALPQQTIVAFGRTSCGSLYFRSIIILSPEISDFKTRTSALSALPRLSSGQSASCAVASPLSEKRCDKPSKAKVITLSAGNKERKISVKTPLPLPPSPIRNAPTCKFLVGAIASPPI